MPDSYKALMKRVGPPHLALRRTARRLLVSAEYGTAGLVVRKLRGKKCRSYQSFMNEIGASLQFFYGFGENWAAVYELLCFMDEWLPGSGYVLVVEGAEELFRDTPEQMRTFVRVVERVGEHWTKPVVGNARHDRPARPFHVVFETDADADALANDLRSQQVAFFEFD